MKEKIKKYWDIYWSDTPKKIRQIGACCLACSGFITTTGIICGMTWLPIVALILGLLGKVITNFYTEKSE